MVEENILTVKKSRPHFIALILIVSEDATTSQVASTCLQNEYDCIVLFYFLSFGAKGGKVGYSSEVPDVCVCVCVNCGGFVWEQRECKIHQWRFSSQQDNNRFIYQWLFSYFDEQFVC